VKHDEIQYEEIRKNLYLESEAVRALTDEQVAAIRKKMEITISGQDLVRPVQTISQLNLDAKLETQIKFEKPTPIQAQAVPAILSGRDVIGIAKTGSGKTFAYLWPLIVHLLAQKATPEPHAMVIAPTRELCQQIFAEATRLCGPFQLRIVPLFGGVEKKDQFRDLKKGCDLIICTPVSCSLTL
jgi:superfamily II DNA/RNA helicase